MPRRQPRTQAWASTNKATDNEAVIGTHDAEADTNASAQMLPKTTSPDGQG